MGHLILLQQSLSIWFYSLGPRQNVTHPRTVVQRTDSNEVKNESHSFSLALKVMCNAISLWKSLRTISLDMCFKRLSDINDQRKWLLS